MTGTIRHILGSKKTFCIIQSEGVEIFSHQREFVNPEIMKVGQTVAFRIKEVQKGKRPEATDVIAA